MIEKIKGNVKIINDGVKTLYEDEIDLNVLRQKNENDIVDRKKRAEQSFVARMDFLKNAELNIENQYKTQINKSSNMSRKADEDCKTFIQQKCAELKRKCDTYVRQDLEYIRDLEEKCRIVAKNNDKLLRKYTTATFNPNRKPDLNRLFSLYVKIMTDTAESFIKRTFKRDGFYSQDDMIKDFLRGSGEAIAYLNNEIKVVIPGDYNREAKKIVEYAESVRRNALSVLPNADVMADNKKKSDLRENEQQKAKAKSQYEAELVSINNLAEKYKQEEKVKQDTANSRKQMFLASDNVTQFSKRIKNILVGTGEDSSEWASYNPERSIGEAYTLGKIKLPFSVNSSELKMSIQRAIPEYFDGQYYKVPFVLKSEKAVKMYVKYDNSTKNEMYLTIQRFILQKMRVNSVKRVQVYFADPNDRGNNLGVLLAANAENEVVGIKTQNTKEGIRDFLKSVVEIIDNTHGELGNYLNIFEFNKKEDRKLKETVVVLCDVQNCVDQETLPMLKVIWENAERCGISVLLTSVSDYTNLEQYYPNIKVDWSFINGKDMFLLKYLSTAKELCFDGIVYKYENTFEKESLSSFVRLYRNCFAESLKIKNVFGDLREKLCVTEEKSEQIMYGKAYDGIRLPVMLDTETNTVCKDFIIGTENSQHTLITGGTGSGKSRFLQMIISSIIMNYHPDDVELWLIDCKKVEFKKFMDKRPAHVRMVSLERTQNFTFAFLDYLSDFANNRTRLFAEAGVTNIKTYREAMGNPYCMPRVVIIIDEFHAITTNVNMDMKYRQLLEDALSEYRNLGISFIFSDQSVSGLKGLTEKGRQQLHNRVAMKNSISEMKETLQVLSENYEDGTLSKMEKSEGLGDFWWNRNPNTRYKAVYIDDKTEENLVDEIIQKGEQAQCDTKVILVDGNERVAFDELAVRKKLLSEKIDPFSTPPTCFCLGVPTTLDEMFSFNIIQKYNNNILIAGRDTRMTVDVIFALLRSAVIAGNSRIIVFADCVDDRYNVLRRYINVVGIADKVEIYDDYEEICPVINSLYSAVKKKRPLPEKTLVFWLGMVDMYDEFCVSPAKPANMATEQAEERTKKDGGFVLQNIEQAMGDAELLSLAAQIGISAEGILANISTTDQNEDKNNVADEGMCYNAVQDMLDLFAMGGKFGLHNVVSFEHSHDARRIKGFNADNFIHKIAFSMSRDESVEWGFRSAAAELTEGLTAYYTDGINQNIFKPFITIK